MVLRTPRGDSVGFSAAQRVEVSEAKLATRPQQGGSVLARPLPDARKGCPPRAGLGEGGPSQGLSREDFLSKGGLQPAFDALPWGSADRGRRHGADGGLPFSVVFLTVSR